MKELRVFIQLTRNLIASAVVLILLNEVAASGQRGIPRLTAEVLFKLPLSPMSPVEMAPLYERKLPFYQYGPWSLAVDEGRLRAYVPDDDKRCVLEVDWSGRVVKELRSPKYQGKFSDLFLDGSKLYAGCFDDKRIIVFDTKNGRILKSFRLSQGGFKPRYFIARAAISRVGRDKKGRIFAVICDFGNKPKLVVIDERSAKVIWSYQAADWDWALHLGVVSPNGEWLFLKTKYVLIPEALPNTYLPMNELYKLPLGGKPERAIDLRTSNPKEKWYITQVLGFDRAKQLYLIAVKTRLEHPPRGKRIPMLLRVNWDMSSYQVLGWCDADSGIQRAPGARHGIVTPSGSVYFIMRLSEKLQRDKPVDFGLARLTYD